MTTHPKHGAERSLCESKPDNGEYGRTVSPVGPPDKLGVARAKHHHGSEATRPAISYRNHHRHHFDTNMDELRGGISRFKEDITDRLGWSKRKADKPGPGGRGESVGSSSSIPQPESRVSTGSGREQEGGRPNTENENIGASSAADENRPDWRSTASSSAKLVLRAVRDSANAIPPLKSVAGCLCFIMENYEVRYLPS